MRYMVLTFALAASAASCGRAPPSPAQLTEQNHARADELHERAIRLHGQRRWAERAARLHRQSARLRPVSDPRAYECYAQAAEVLLAAGKSERALNLMTESAEYALSRGDSLGAARSYADAVLIAAQQQDPQTVIRLADRVRALATISSATAADTAALSAQIARALNAAHVTDPSTTDAPSLKPRSRQ